MHDCPRRNAFLPCGRSARSHHSPPPLRLCARHAGQPKEGLVNQKLPIHIHGTCIYAHTCTYPHIEQAHFLFYSCANTGIYKHMYPAAGIHAVAKEIIVLECDSWRIRLGATEKCH